MIGKRAKWIIGITALVAVIAALAYLIYYFYMKSQATKNAKTYNPASTASQGDKNLAAFLMLIRNGESKITPDAYCISVGGTASRPIYFTDPNNPDFTRHPRKYNANLNSDAAGAYQIISTTWDWINKNISLADFSPASQDKAAIWLISYRGAYDAIVKGDLTTALIKCRNEWASLPTSKYGQPTQSEALATSIYINNGGLIA